MNVKPIAWPLACAATLVSGGVCACPLGDVCTFDNYQLLDDFGAGTSQLDTNYPFYAEAASDFTLTCEGADAGDSFVLDTLMFAADPHNIPPGVDPHPSECWLGVRVTVYEDGETFCGAGFAKGPAGEPVDSTGEHVLYCRNAVVCELDVPMDRVAVVQSDFVCAGLIYYELLVTELASFDCRLQADRKYWIAPAPMVWRILCGQTSIVLSQGASGQPDQRIFPFLGLPWTVVGNLDACPPNTPPAGTRQDLAIALTAIAAPPGGDLDGDGMVGPADLAILLGAWGPCPDPPAECPADLNGDGNVGPGDLAILLGGWG